jgi:hypothetical protein
MLNEAKPTSARSSVAADVLVIPTRHHLPESGKHRNPENKKPRKHNSLIWK